MDLELTGKTAVVTGASRGIGLAIVRMFLKEGMRVVGGARTITPELKETGAVAVSVDLATEAGATELVRRALEELDDIDVLVNNVGGGDVADIEGIDLATGLDADDEFWRKIWELNMLSAVRMTRAALPSLIRRQGNVINISSIGARAPQTGPLAYTTAKAALNAFGRGLAEHLAPKGVRVNTVSPGPTRTTIWEDPHHFGGVVAKAVGISHAEVLEQAPNIMGMLTDRLIEPDEIAAVVALLASPRGYSTTGAEYVVDGGAIKAT